GGLRDRGPAAGLHRPASGNVSDLLVEYGPEHFCPLRLYLGHGPTAGWSWRYQERRGLLAQLAGQPQGGPACGASLRLARLPERRGRPGLVPQLPRPTSEPAGAARSPTHGPRRW